MRKIVDLLHEKRKIEAAKRLLEDAGYTVSKDYDEYEINSSIKYMIDYMISIQELIENYGGKDLFIKERGSTAELDIPCKLLGGNYYNVFTISDQDDYGVEMLELYNYLKKKEVKREELPDRAGYCILMNTELGEFVYQNQWGMGVLYKKYERS